MNTGIHALARALNDRRLANRDPEMFARSLGIRMDGRVTFYGINRDMFGSEPWLVSFGDCVFVTAGVQFITHDGGTLILRREVPDLEWTAPIRVESNVYLGLRAMILPGVTIGNRSIIGAGSVVTHDIAPNTVAAGAPARPIGTVDDYLRRMQIKSLGLGHLEKDQKEYGIRMHYGVEQVPREGRGRRYLPFMRRSRR